MYGIHSPTCCHQERERERKRERKRGRERKRRETSSYSDVRYTCILAASTEVKSAENSRGQGGAGDVKKGAHVNPFSLFSRSPATPDGAVSKKTNRTNYHQTTYYQIPTIELLTHLLNSTLPYCTVLYLVSLQFFPTLECQSYFTNYFSPTLRMDGRMEEWIIGCSEGRKKPCVKGGYNFQHDG